MDKTTQTDLAKIQLVVRHLQDQRNTALNSQIDRMVERDLAYARIEELSSKVEELTDAMGRLSTTNVSLDTKAAELNSMVVRLTNELAFEKARVRSIDKALRDISENSTPERDLVMSFLSNRETIKNISFSDLYEMVSAFMDRASALYEMLGMESSSSPHKLESDEVKEGT